MSFKAVNYCITPCDKLLIRTELVNRYGDEARFVFYHDIGMATKVHVQMRVAVEGSLMASSLREYTRRLRGLEKTLEEVGLSIFILDVCSECTIKDGEFKLRMDVWRTRA